jgi:hypothetical protein
MHVTPSRSPLVTNYFPANIFLPRRCIHTHTQSAIPPKPRLFSTQRECTSASAGHAGQNSAPAPPAMSPPHASCTRPGQAAVLASLFAIHSTQVRG